MKNKGTNLKLFTYKTYSLRKGEIIFFWALELQTEQFTESSSTDISRARFCISF